MAHSALGSVILTKTLVLTPSMSILFSPIVFLIGTFLLIAIVILDYHFSEGWQQFGRTPAVNGV